MPGEIDPGGHQVLSSPVQGLVALALVNQVVLYNSTKLWRRKNQSHEISISEKWWGCKNESSVEDSKTSRNMCEDLLGYSHKQAKY